ncbi:hypothetical protein G0U57_003668 [Chelydra serpentina]|uniref:Integrase catalytic domain-containing protein n=1 Tax=Chelydra serpentina TaxID=8475 RepID=A0A8T1RZD1_CHESE|nr:hypothetical protein G0U57_003668 [Chelydra serpentina]
MVNADPQVQKSPIAHQRIEGPWARLQIDYTGPPPVTPGNSKYCLVIVDPFTKWIEAIPTKTNTALTTARQLFKVVFSRWGLPKEINSDQGPHFIGETMQEMCKLLGIKQRFHIAGHPQSSGQVEQINCTLKDALRKMGKENGKDWDEKLSMILMVLRSVSASPGYTPFVAMTGRDTRTLQQWWLDVDIPDGWQPKVANHQWIRSLLDALK